MRIVAGFLCILLMAGCSGKDKVPSGVIGRDEMGNILWDMMQADQYSANYLIKDSAKINVKIETLKLYEEVFRLHKITREEFRKSFQFYQDRPDITRVIFDSLATRGNRMRIENYSHPSTSTPSGTVVKPITPSGPIPAAAGNKLGRTPVGIPGRPAGTLPNRPPGNQPAIFSPGRDTTNRHIRGNHFLPGNAQKLPPGAHPFMGRNAAMPTRADSLAKKRQ